jgi:hypothetical protein
MKTKLITSFLIFMFCSVLSAQNRIGKWRSYLPYSNASRLIVAGQKVYCVTSGGLFSYNQADKSVEKVSKENGLSDTEISALAYSPESGTTIIAYINSNIDIIENNKVINIPDILRYTQILGDKKIYSIMIHGGTAYLSTGFGIVVLNIASREISATFKIGPEGSQIRVNETSTDGNTIFAATESGIYSASLDAPNLQDYQYWSRVNDIADNDREFSSVIYAGGYVFASCRSEEINGPKFYRFDGSAWTEFLSYPDNNCNYISETGGNIVITTLYNIKIMKPDGEMLRQVFTGSPKCAYLDGNNVLWAADAEKGLVMTQTDDQQVSISPDGPSTIFVSDIAISSNILYTVPGGLNSSNNNQFRNAEVNTLKNDEWVNFHNTQYKDFYRIAIDPADPEHYYAGSWGYGLFEFDKDSLQTVFRDDNSSLQTIIPGDFFRIGGLCFDDAGNLWVTNASVPRPLSVLKKSDGKWKSFDLNNILPSTIYTGDITVDHSGYKWMILTSHSRGLLVMDDNNTIDNADDDRYKRLDIKDENNAIITNEVYAINEDHDGNIWLGTNKGILVYYNPRGVFSDQNFYAQQIIIPRNDGTPYGDALLGTESVTAIAVDGANRKWLGTKNAGVSLVSPDGLKQIYNFTAENSPLLSNSISSISINDKTGEVFFGTDKGIISFMAEATGPSDNFNSLLVFPNPVRENYTGEISITGLTENSIVKITDLNGNLVYEAESLGGQLLWNGKNYRDERVGTGVYLVFCTREDGGISKVTKILFIH